MGMENMREETKEREFTVYLKGKNNTIEIGKMKMGDLLVEGPRVEGADRYER